MVANEKEEESGGERGKRACKLVVVRLESWFSKHIHKTYKTNYIYIYTGEMSNGKRIEIRKRF